jgi:hypothetical protein
MNEAEQKDLIFYAEHSSLSSPGKYAALFDDMPSDINLLCKIIQGLVIHAFWVSEKNYGVSIASLKSHRNLNQEYNLRSMEEMLSAIQVLDPRPLIAPRPADKRLIGNCRDYALFLTSVLRSQGIPARVRSGVARYFYSNGHLEDHFITEWWNAKANRWQYTDPQIDEVMKKTCHITMDMTDLARDQFLHAGLGYAELHEDKVTPEQIGIFDFKGIPYVRYKLFSDLVCLNKVEVLAWEGWGIVESINDLQMNQEDQDLLDDIAALLLRYDTEVGAFDDITKLFVTNPRLQIPHDYIPHFMEFSGFR